MSGLNERTPPANAGGAVNELGKGSTASYDQCFDEARRASSHGISVLPPNENGSKSPLCEHVPATCTKPRSIELRAVGKKSWVHRQHRRAGEDALKRWYLDEYRQGVGYICGAISGGLLMIEFEGRAVDNGTYEDFLALGEKVGLGDLIDEIREGYEEESPSGGIHWFIFCDDSITQVLASTWVTSQSTGKAGWRPLIEPRGEGGYAICSPSSGSVHPSGRPWRQLHGGPDTIVRLSPEELDAICSLARYFDQKPLAVMKPPGQYSMTAKGRPGDDYDDRATWSEVLEPHGWESLFTDIDGWEHWCRPGKEPKGTSATITPDGRLLYVFSTSTSFEANKAYGKFPAYAILNHSCSGTTPDWRKAAGQDRDGW